MEDVIQTYFLPYDPLFPVVCFDESPLQLIGEVRQPISAAPGQPARYDYEYKRNGTVNLFVCLDVHRPWRQVTVTSQRTAQDYACCLRDLVDIHYPEADRIRVVQDNLSTHTAGALYETFPPEEAHRLLRRLEFHYTPKHASWLNMVEIEIGVLRGQQAELPAQLPSTVLVESDGQRVMLTARDELVLRCGRSSITMGADGRMTLKADVIVSEAAELNRVRGGSVQLN